MALTEQQISEIGDAAVDIAKKKISNFRENEDSASFWDPTRLLEAQKKAEDAADRNASKCKFGPMFGG